MAQTQVSKSGRTAALWTTKVVALVLFLASLTACADSSNSSALASRTQALWSLRTARVGDNSRVAHLVHEIGPAPDGSYSLSLHTTTLPYALSIDLNRLDKPFAITDFKDQATLVLGLIANLDSVSVTSETGTRTLTTASASRQLGYDVKDLDRDRGKLRTYLSAIGD